jgi:hypothetical protein
MRQATFVGGSYDGARLVMSGDRLPDIVVAGSEFSVYRLRTNRYVEACLSESLSEADERAWQLRDGMRLVAAVVARSRRARPPWRSSGLLRLLSTKDDDA